MAAPLRREGFDIEVLTLYRRQGSMPPLHPLVEEAQRHGIRAEQLDGDPKLSLRATLRVTDKLRREGFSLLHSHDYKTDLLGLAAARLARVPCVATVHGYVFVSRRLRIYRMLDLLALRYFPRIITVSDALRRELLASGLPEKKVVTVHNAIDWAAFVSQATQRNLTLHQQLGIDPDQPLITVVGRLIPGKGHQYFLQAARKLLQACPKARFLLVGEGPLREKLEALAVSLNMQHAVFFLGFREDVAAFIEASAVVVLPSLEEGLPMVLLEALALAKPVIATAVGGVSEIIRHKETGLLVPPRDPTRLAETMLYLLKNPEEGQRLAETGNLLVKREFTVETMARKIAQVYREVLGLI